MKKINPLKKYRLLSIIALFVLLTSFVNKAHSQVEVEPWGDINGIREHGQLFELRSTLKMRTGDNYVSTNREKQHQHYKRVGDEQVITTNIDSLYLNETVKDESDGKIKVTFTLNAHAEMRFDALYFAWSCQIKIMMAAERVSPVPVGCSVLPPRRELTLMAAQGEVFSNRPRLN